MKDIIIFDLDGTLALIEHRRHFVEAGKRQWKEFFAACVDDKPNVPVIRIYQSMLTCGFPFQHKIFSGRSDEVRKETEEWLDKHVGLYHELKMRREGDYTPDEELKRAWALPILNRIYCVFDDRDKVVKMWRDLGVTCLQVADGGF